jgi:glycosyltransferase involved in cell wall biosynthesis
MRKRYFSPFTSHVRSSAEHRRFATPNLKMGKSSSLTQMTSLRIGMDGDALRAPLSGVGHYILNLARELDGLLPEASFIAYTRLPAAAVVLPSRRWQLRTEPVPAFRRLPSFVWLKTRCRSQCLRDRINVFWAGRSLHPRLGPAAHTVCTVHDVNYLVAPETMQFQSLWSSRLFFRRDILSADAVLTNSSGTAERIRTMIGAKVTGVVRPSVTSHFHLVQQGGIPEKLSSLGIKRPYLLSVATAEPRKNLGAVLDAFIDLKRSGSLTNHQLVLVGPTGWKNQALKKKLDETRAYGLVLAGYVPDELLPALYAGSEALVFPSLYEGFGMPVLEARTCGARVVTTDIPELREAGDEHVIYVQPTVEGVKTGITKAVSSPKPPLMSHRTWKDEAQILANTLSKNTESRMVAAS